MQIFTHAFVVVAQTSFKEKYKNDCYTLGGRGSSSALPASRQYFLGWRPNFLKHQKPPKNRPLYFNNFCCKAIANV
jgi:hypothetical protein